MANSTPPFHWKRSYTDWTYVKGTTCFIDKDASQMIDCCKTKHGLSCFCVSPAHWLSEGRVCPPRKHRSTATLEKTACCLFSYLKVQITANTLWHGLDAPVAPGQLRAWWGLRLKCLESAFGMSSVRNNLALVKLLQLLTLLKEGLKPIPWPPAYIIYVWPLPSFHEFTAEGQERCESTLT